MFFTSVIGLLQARAVNPVNPFCNLSLNYMLMCILVTSHLTVSMQFMRVYFFSYYKFLSTSLFPPEL